MTAISTPSKTGPRLARHRALAAPNTPRRSRQQGGLGIRVRLLGDAEPREFRSAAVQFDRRFRIALAPSAYELPPTTAPLHALR
jgi:hypothetical protein